LDFVLGVERPDFSPRQACARILGLEAVAYLIHEQWAVTCSAVVSEAGSRVELKFPWDQGHKDAEVYTRYEHVAFLKMHKPIVAAGVRPLSIYSVPVEAQTEYDIWDIQAPQRGRLVVPYKPDGSQSRIEIGGSGIGGMPGTPVCVGDKVIGHLLPRSQRSPDVIEAFPVQRLREQLRAVHRRAMLDAVVDLLRANRNRHACSAFVSATRLEGATIAELAARLLDPEQPPDALLQICADALRALPDPDDDAAKSSIRCIALCALPPLYGLGSIHESRGNGGSNVLLEID